MSQSQPQTTPVFRTSLRDWQARFKARQAARSSAESADEVGQADRPATPSGPTRVKKLVAYKRRKMMQAAARHSK